MDGNQSERGGKRENAGRPSFAAQIRRDPRWLAARGVNPLGAAEILQFVCDERKTWKRLLNSEDDRVVLSAMQFLVSMRDGKPSQQLNITSTHLSLNANDLERARAIVAEIRSTVPSLGPSTEPNNGPMPPVTIESPLQVDASTSSGATAASTAKSEKGSIMLRRDGAAEKDG